MTGGALGNFVSSVTKTGGTFNFLYDLVEKSQDLLLKNAAALDPIFESFDYEKFTCLHAAILRAKYFSQQPLNKEVIFNQTSTFFEHCNVEHARKIPAYMRSISAEYCNMMISWGAAIRGIQPIITIIKRFQPSTDCFTPFHTDLCQLSLSAKIFNPVLPILNADILEVDKNNASLDLKDYLLYFYYGGMIYAALKMWDRGLHFLELCLTMPAHPSCIQVEAAKKVILLSLMHHGKFMTVLDAPTPHFTTPKPWKRYCKPYMALATAFQSNDPEELTATVERHRDIFVADQNFGLVKQVLKNHVKFRIASLTKTFITMSLADVASRVKLDSSQEAEKHLVEMIESKAIFAQIDQLTGTVYFCDDPEQYNSLDMFLTLQKKIEECVALEQHLMRVSDEIVNSPCYAKRMLELETKAVKTAGPY